VQSETSSGNFDPAHTQFLADKLGVVLRSRAYLSLSGKGGSCADLLTTTALTPSADIYGVAISCDYGNDVLQASGSVPEAVPGSYYENAGANGPYVADVVKTATAARNWVAVTSGYDIEHLFSRYCDTGGGRLAWYYYMLNKAFAGICQLTCPGAPCLTLDTPGSSRGGDVVDFLKIGDAVMRRGSSTVRLGIPIAGRVQVGVYDVAGRKVRLLADRVFSAGEHTLTWDGADDDGRPVARGVYFVRSSTQKDAGRIIVLNR
jgi:hypothetical protein